MSNPFFFVKLMLRSLQDFLDHVSADAGRELDEIEKHNQDGMYLEFEDYEAALDPPFIRLEIASRAVLYELVALVETELQMFAYSPWLYSPKYKGPKSIIELNRIDEESLSKVKMVSDLRFNDIVALIEGYYRINLNSLPKWKKVLEMRNMVNSFKHCQGFQDS